MAKPRLTIHLLVDTEAHAQTVLTAIANRAEQSPVFAVDGRTVSPAEGGVGFLASFDVRFQADVDRDSVRSWLRSELADHPQVKVWVSKALIQRHQCRHDEEPSRPCVVTDIWEHPAGRPPGT